MKGAEEIWGAWWIMLMVYLRLIVLVLVRGSL